MNLNSLIWMIGVGGAVVVITIALRVWRDSRD